MRVLQRKNIRDKSDFLRNPYSRVVLDRETAATIIMCHGDGRFFFGLLESGSKFKITKEELTNGCVTKKKNITNSSRETTDS